LAPKGNLLIRRVLYGLIAFFTTAGLLFGGYALAQRVKSGPINREDWKSRGVLEFDTRQEGEEFILEVEAGKIDQPRLTLETLISRLERGKGRRITRVLFKAPEVPELEEVYNELAFALAEAQATGRYTLLPTTADRIASKKGVQIGLEVGEDFIFIHLQQGKSRLYRSVRLTAPVGSIMNSVGGER
jgi:hypothetical protein